MDVYGGGHIRLEHDRRRKPCEADRPASWSPRGHEPAALAEGAAESSRSEPQLSPPDRRWVITTPRSTVDWSIRVSRQWQDLLQPQYRGRSRHSILARPDRDRRGEGVHSLRALRPVPTWKPALRWQQVQYTKRPRQIGEWLARGDLRDRAVPPSRDDRDDDQEGLTLEERVPVPMRGALTGGNGSDHCLHETRRIPVRTNCL